MTQRLSFTKIKKQLLPPTERWEYAQWRRFFQEEGIYTDFTTLEVIKKYLRPTRGVSYKISVVEVVTTSDQCRYLDTQIEEQWHRLSMPLSIEAICMFRKTYRYTDALTNFGSDSMVAFYMDPLGRMPHMQMCMQCWFGRDLLMVRPLHQHSPVSPANRILYAG